jgi:hypothetical protein
MIEECMNECEIMKIKKERKKRARLVCVYDMK